jgi:hypothetical protein
MARFRIVRRQSPVVAGRAFYEVRERDWIWWEYRGIYGSLHEAEQRVKELQNSTPVKTKIIKEYD